MIISSNTGAVFKKYGYEKGLEMFRKGGFDYIDLSLCSIGDDLEDFWGDNYKDATLKLKAKADSLGIKFNQTHAPFHSYSHGNDDYNAMMLNKIIRSIEISGMLGASVIVVHPYMYPDRQNHMDENIEFYKKLIPYAEKANIKVATENMWAGDPKRGYISSTAFSYAEDLLEFIKRINSEWITVCLDLGHSCLVGREAQDEIYALKGYIGALHVHDTDYKSDLHTLCYHGDQMWDEITQALRETNYNGDFTYECEFVSKLPAELVSSGLKYMHDIAEYLVRKIEE